MEILHKPHNREFKDKLIGLFPEIQSFPVSTDEKMWLKYIIVKVEAGQFLTETVIEKINHWLEDVTNPTFDREIKEKGQVPMNLPRASFLSRLRDGILKEQVLEVELASGKVVQGVPLKIEVWLSIGEWILLLQTSLGIQKVKLSEVMNIEEINGEVGLQNVEPIIEKESILIEVPPQYNEEKHRLFYLFSSFEKEIQYDDPHYRIKLYYTDDEEDYLLSTLLMLGKKIKVVDEKWQWRLAEEVRAILGRNH